MEEILSSIRKIISEDEDEEGMQSSDAGETSSEDVLELTERVEEEDNVGNSDTDTPTFLSGGGDEGEEDGLVSSKTKSKVTSAMASFAGALTKDKKQNEPVVGGGPTLDILVLNALEPVLKTWLDENLEPLVERLVKEELKRMARRAEDDL